MGDKQADASETGEWITFEQAGRLIDGPKGWWMNNDDGKRPRAQALLNFARGGQVRVKAKSWTVTKRGTDKNPPNPEDTEGLFQMLIAREKAQRDQNKYSLPNGFEYSNTFTLADDRNGHFDALRLEIGPNRTENRVIRHVITGLRFNRGDIADLFELAAKEGPSPKVLAKAQGGRPTAADWEGAALEMARRFYLGDLKPTKIVDVHKELTAWLAEQDVHPGHNTLWEHAKRYFEAFLSWEAE